MPRILLAPRPSGKASYSIAIAPLPAGHEHGVAALLIADPAGQPPTETTLRTLYGLTRAESRVAVALLRGSTPDEIADAFEVSIATIRTHLQRIFTKTATRRQSELIRLLVAATAAYDRDDEQTP